MNFTKRCLILVALLFKIYISNAQVNLQLNNDLNLSQGLVFGQPINLYNILLASDRLKSDSVTQIISHANEFMADLLHHPIFDHIEIVLNDEDVLVLYTLFISDKQKTNQYHEKILSSLTKHYGLADSTKDSWLFRKGDEYARFIISPKGNCELSVGTDKYIHAIESFDKKEKLTFIYTKGHLFNHNDPGLANGQDTSYFDSFTINFSGIKETKTIRLYMAAEHNDIKEISLLMNGGETIRLKPDKKNRSKPYYFYEFNLSRQIADKLFKQNYTTISFNGKFPNKVDIPDDSLMDFSIIYKYQYHL